MPATAADAAHPRSIRRRRRRRQTDLVGCRRIDRGVGFNAVDDRGRRRRHGRGNRHDDVEGRAMVAE